MSKIKSYSELMNLKGFKDRFDYLFLGSSVGAETFGVSRYLNQVFYRSPEWKRTRRQIILRDEACDLACSDRELDDLKFIRVHHINPITVEDIRNRSCKLFDPNNLITCLDRTHQAIHYTGYEGCLQDIIERRPMDTCPWR